MLQNVKPGAKTFEFQLQDAKTLFIFIYTLLIVLSAENQKEVFCMEKMNIEMKQLLDGMEAYWLEKGYASTTIKVYRRIWDDLAHFCEGMDKDGQISIESCQSYLSDWKHNTTWKASDANEKNAVRSIRLVIAYISGTGLSYASRSAIAPPQFLGIAETYLASLVSRGEAKSSQTTKISRVKQFLVYLDSIGKVDFAQVDRDTLLGFMEYLASKYSPRAKSGILYTLRGFLGYCENIGSIKDKLSAIIKGIHVNPNETIPTVFSTVEVRHLLETVDRGSAKGKKRYAILILAAQLGLRAIDIIRITIDDIQWDQSLLEFTQKKTGTVVRLPLMDSVKNALLDYLVNCRPETPHRELFVRDCPPIAPYVKSAMIYRIVSEQVKSAGISCSGRHCGPHALRHSFASAMLGNETPLPVIASALGHINTKNTMNYLRVDIGQLRRIALEVPQ